MERFLALVAALSGLAGVIADASARHALAGDPARMDLAATGARYGLVHAAVLLALAALLRHAERGARRAWLLGAAWCFVAALVLFCGTLYLQAAGLAAVLLPLVPVGGTLFIAGWAALAIGTLMPGPME
jgi:uncharacterized membrane protein YgdD (TMEM256/DUF423 family)